MSRSKRVLSLLAFLGLLLSAAERKMDAWRGKTPKVDGVLSPGEYDDAATFTGVRDWIPQFTPTTEPTDLALRGWVKHDGSRLYFAFAVTDDVLYGIDTPRWLPENNPKAHELSPSGYPWFGDEMEILLNSTNRYTANESVRGTGESWQMVCNLTKSRLGGVGKGGLLEGEPRVNSDVFARYRKWIETGAQQCAAVAGKRGYVIEWAVSFEPCVEVEPGIWYSPSLGDRAVGLNIALGDLDEKSKGAGNFANFHHEDWWSGAKDVRTQLRHFGALMLRAGSMPGR